MLVTAMGCTAFLSMWMSNIAAAALMFACVRPVLKTWPSDLPARRTLLVGVAFGANLGGIATPVGTGPNAIAIASISASRHISFVEWMTFALPLTVAFLIGAYLLLLWRGKAEFSTPLTMSMQPEAAIDGEGHSRSGQTGFLAVLALTVLLWLTEPLHGISAPVIALGSAALLFLSGLLASNDLRRIDWSTLLLIAGGITMGRMIETSGLVASASERFALAELHPIFALFFLCLASAVLSALMSNTATAVLLIPLANAIMPLPSTAILIAVSSSFGMPFLISTPPNAMAYGEGGVRSSDLLYPGLVIMLIGCAVVSLTGRPALNFAGIP
jgi:sodium-dependent dicarboxylate transporter 2/3/5